MMDSTTFSIIAKMPESCSLTHDVTKHDKTKVIGLFTRLV
jgi:hypothetical protein